MSLVHCPSSWFPLSRHGQCCDFGGGQYFGHPMQRTDSLEKTLMLGKTEGKRRRRRQDDKGRDSWVASLTLWTWVWAGSGGDGQGSLMCCSPWGRKESDTTERLSWTELVKLFAGKQWRHRYGEQTCGHSAGRRGWGEWRQRHGNSIHHHAWDRELVRMRCVTQGARPRALWQHRGLAWGGRQEGGAGGRGPRETCGWLMLMWGRDQHNVVKQLSSN